MISVVFEEKCESCGKLRELKYCPVIKLHVCYNCCTLCKKRPECNERVWFKQLIIKDKKKQNIRKYQEKTLDKYLNI